MSESPKPADALRTLPERAFRARARLVAGVFCLVCCGLAVRLYFCRCWAAAGTPTAPWASSCGTPSSPPTGAAFIAPTASFWRPTAAAGPSGPRPGRCRRINSPSRPRGLAEILELDEGKLLEKFSDRHSNDCLLRYRVDRAMADAVRDFCEANGITGIRIDQDSKRWYPQGEFLASVLGFTNVDNAGVAGLELKYDDLLTGENGVVLTAVNAWGYTLEQSYETERFPTEGDGLRLTIDSCVQHYLENALSYAVQEHHVAARAVGIVMDVNTGAVLAMSTTPSYDPNEPRVIADTAARNTVEALTGDARKTALQLAQQTQWRNKAVSDLYEPGSVFKLITCAAALDAGAITKHSSFYCGESISVAGTRFHCANHKRHGAQSVTQALENSCNQSFIQSRGPAGQRGLLRIILPPSACGSPPASTCPPSRKKSLYYTADRMGPVELASCAFGQSSKISYLEMASAVCAVVNGGRLMQPYVVSDILGPEGEVIDHLSPVLQAAGAERGDLPHHAGDDGGCRPLRRRTERPDRGLPGRRQERHQPEVGQRRRKSPYCQLCGRGSHRRPAVFVSGVLGRTPQLDDRRRQPVGPGLCRSAGADAGVQGCAPRRGTGNRSRSRPDRCRPARRR